MQRGSSAGWCLLQPRPVVSRDALYRLRWPGRANAASSRIWWGRQAARLVPTRANNQPAFGYYLHDARAPIAHAHGLFVLTLAGDKICAITRFGDNSLFPHFGLPRTLRD